MFKRTNQTGIRVVGRMAIIVTLMVSVALLAALILAACGGQKSSSTQSQQTQGTQTVKRGGTCYIINVMGLPWSANFNPLIAPLNYTPTSWGFVYEPLVILNSFYTPGTPAPREYMWLASAYAWSKDNRTLTFKVRKGVKWSDGQPFTAADVLFTFNLIKKFPALDIAGVWPSLNSVRQQGTDEVVMSIKPGGIPGFQAIASNTYIVPQHIWENISDPVTYVDRNPVGTGPFLVETATPQLLVYKRNPNYWQPGRPYIDKVIYPDYTSNTTANRDLCSDTRGAWGGQFVPDIQKAYIAKDPTYRHYWFPSVNNWVLFPNLTNDFLKNPLVRQAISYGINRSEVAQKAEYGYTLPASQTGVLTRFTAWYDKQADAQYNFYRCDPAKAISLLTQAGFTRGSDGMFRASNGQKLSLSIIVPGAFSDSVSSGAIMSSDLRKVGIDASVEPLAANTFGSRLASGQFDLAWSQVGFGITPYYELHYLLGSAYTAPIGKPASTNFERWKDAQTDRLLADYADTSDVAAQRRAIDGIQAIMLKQVPVIPVLQGVVWTEWNDKFLVGWPTAQDPYACPAPYMALPDLGVVLTRIHLR